MADWPFTFSVVPRLPPRIEPLRELAYNLWWSWNDQAIGLFKRLDPELWEEAGHNPARLLRRVSQARLEAAAENADFCHHLDQVCGQLHGYLGKSDRWFRRTYGDGAGKLIAYFSAEFGFHQSLPIYSGGLGILAGDHCKAASDLGLPFVAVGLLYRLGYFKQRINKDGWQESDSVDWDFYELPISEVRKPGSEEPLMVQVSLPGRELFARIWEVKVGLIKLYLLDADVPENQEEDRRITYQLYGGDHEMRIKQEILLGIGGTRALKALGLQPSIYHMNEGHAAFLGMERIRDIVLGDGLGFHEALQVVAASSLFTTHTPVPAGNDAFSPELMEVYFGDFAKEMEIPFEDFLRFGRPWESKPTDLFSMTILALRTSRQANGVSAIHGLVSREMWQSVWPGVPRAEIPIGHITNGIHTLTWMAPEIRELFEKAGADFWEDRCSDPEAWKVHRHIGDEDLWRIHVQLKRKLIHFVRYNQREQRLRSGFSAPEIRAAESVLDPDILTIGFARRFATYKRATLLFRDLKRLDEILNDSQRPVQILFAGKAHPADDGGKKLIQKIYQVAQMPEFRNRVVFIENYDINVAKHLYHGVDIWLNNPTRPLEASGTSGQKVPPNGGLNFSVRDGWWDEACHGDNGWAIGEEVKSPDPHVQDEFDAFSIYTRLQHEIAPLYYRRDEWGIPREWIQWMRRSIETVCPVFNTFRMVQDYTNQYYVKAAQQGHNLRAEGFRGARNLSEWKQRIRKNWPEVTACDVVFHHPETQRVCVGAEFPVECRVRLGKLEPSEVLVEAYVRPTSGSEEFFACHPLSAAEELEDGWRLFRGIVRAGDSGTYRFNVRVIPFHPDLVQKHELRLTCWAE